MNLIAHWTTRNVLKILTSIEDETWQQYAKMVENNQQFAKLTLLEKTKLAREISDGKNEIPHKFLDRKI